MRVRMISPNRELQRQIDLWTRTDSPSRHIGEKLLSRRVIANSNERSLFRTQSFSQLSHEHSQSRTEPYNTLSPKGIPIVVEPIQELSDTKEQSREEQVEVESHVADIKDYQMFTVKDVNDIIAKQSRKKSPKEIIFELYREKYGYFVPTATGANTSHEPRRLARMQTESKAAEKYQTTIFTQLVDDVCKE